MQYVKGLKGGPGTVPKTERRFCVVKLTKAGPTALKQGKQVGEKGAGALQGINSLGGRSLVYGRAGLLELICLSSKRGVWSKN